MLAWNLKLPGILLDYMKRTFRFYKTKEQKWYVDLPEWTKSVVDLEMVEGADTMLDKVAGNSDECYLEMSDELIEGADQMKLVKDRTNCKLGGGDYIMETYKGNVFNHKLWLCSVTEVVFGDLPEVIYVDYPRILDHKY